MKPLVSAILGSKGAGASLTLGYRITAGQTVQPFVALSTPHLMYIARSPYNLKLVLYWLILINIKNAYKVILIEKFPI